MYFIWKWTDRVIRMWRIFFSNYDRNEYKRKFDVSGGIEEDNDSSTKWCSSWRVSNYLNRIVHVHNSQIYPNLTKFNQT